MQASLFPELGAVGKSATVAAALPDPELVVLAGALPDRLRLGTSSWN
jgi:hypothetical protein